MTRQMLAVLHVEDDPDYQKFIAGHLEHLDEYAVALSSVDTEDKAIARVEAGGVDFILLDYELAAGNGLSCVRRIRQLDAMVPIVVLSATTNSRLAGELLKAGADDFVQKQDLSRDDLVQLVHETLARSSFLRQRMASSGSAGNWDKSVDAEFRALCERFLNLIGPDLFHLIDSFEMNCRKRKLSAEQLQRVFENVCLDLQGVVVPDRPPIKRRLRPVVLELLVRLFGSVSADKATADESA